MDFRGEGLLQQRQNPIDHILLHEGWDQSLFDTAFLQNCQTKPLAN